MSGDLAALWDGVNDLRERMARMEERELAAKPVLDRVAKNVDDLKTLVEQAKGAKTVSLLFGRWGYGAFCAFGGWLLGHWELAQKFFKG